MNRKEYNTNRPRKQCPNCGKLFTHATFNRHYAACISPDSTLNNQKEVYKCDHDDLHCKFCSRIFTSLNALVQHEIRCKLNPCRKDFDKLIKYVETNVKGQTKETNPAIAKQGQTLKRMFEKGEWVPASKGKPGTFLGKHHTKEEVDKMMRSYKRTILCRPSRYKFGVYKGIKCDSGWELAFVLYCLDRNLPITRCGESFEYIHPIENRRAWYYPDFKIGDVYYEVKGIVDEVVEAKCEQFPKDKTLILLDSKHFTFIHDYCVHTYGKDFYRLYDRNYPSWMDSEDISNF